MHTNPQLPLVNPSVLVSLREDLQNDDAIWTTFICNFLAQLPGRIERLRHTLSTGDLEGAKDAVLSLRTSCQMIGAQQLAQLAHHTEKHLNTTTKDEDPTSVLPRIADTHLQQLSISAQCTHQQLQHRLANHAPAKPDAHNLTTIGASVDTPGSGVRSSAPAHPRPNSRPRQRAPSSLVFRVKPPR